MEETTRNEIIDTIKEQYALDWHGIHGIHHWQRVRINGLRLAQTMGADQLVVELFAYFHDACRLNDGWDPEHGARAAEFIERLNGSLLRLEQATIDQLAYACRYHTDGLLEGDVTIQTCWDADRLDLGRVGIRPLAKFLCTTAARDPATIEWAYRRSRA
jgi:uncharacterized protein